MGMNVNNAVDKAYEDKTLAELADAPVAAIQGISEKMYQDFFKPRGIHTIRDLANWKFVLWAQGIVNLATTEEAPAVEEPAAEEAAAEEE